MSCSNTINQNFCRLRELGREIGELYRYVDGEDGRLETLIDELNTRVTDLSIAVSDLSCNCSGGGTISGEQAVFQLFYLTDTSPNITNDTISLGDGTLGSWSVNIDDQAGWNGGQSRYEIQVSGVYMVNAVVCTNIVAGTGDLTVIAHHFDSTGLIKRRYLLGVKDTAVINGSTMVGDCRPDDQIYVTFNVPATLTRTLSGVESGFNINTQMSLYKVSEL